MTLTEQFSNDTKIRNYTRIYDASHSWLEVPIKDVRTSGTYTEITAYSPLKRHKFYLEEDCDLYTFYKAMTDKGYTINITNINVDDFDQYLKNK
jgi:hypothetical protein